MKQLLFTIFLAVGASGFVSAECEEYISGRDIQKGMLVKAAPVSVQPEVIYVAEITSVSGDAFSCRFLHSNTTYDFVDRKLVPGNSKSRLRATVKANRGGKFRAGEQFHFNVFMKDPAACNWEEVGRGQLTIIATFGDGKSYLGLLRQTDDGYLVYFLHSKSLYTIDRRGRILSVRGGGYAVGGSVKVVHARLLTF